MRVLKEIVRDLFLHRVVFIVTFGMLKAESVCTVRDVSEQRAVLFDHHPVFLAGHVLSQAHVILTNCYAEENK